MNNIQDQLDSLVKAITENTSALREVFAVAALANVVSITETPKLAKLAKSKPVVIPEPEPVAETPTEVDVTVTASDEFNDPLDPETKVVPGTGTPAIDANAVIADCIEIFKTKMAGADDAKKAELKEQFPTLRAKYGLKPDDKLAVLIPTPEKLVELLREIKAL